MIDLTKVGEWQYFDEETKLRFPWFTKPFLDELVTWDLSDKKIFEYGGGSSTVWFSAKPVRVIHCVENDKKYYKAISKELYRIGRPFTILFYDEKDDFVNAIKHEQEQYDIVIVDGDYWRDECMLMALDSVKRGGIIICDNYDQPSVYLPSDEVRGAYSKYVQYTFREPTHEDWQTCYWVINK